MEDCLVRSPDLRGGTSISDHSWQHGPVVLQITSPTTAIVTISVSPTAPVDGNTVVMITGTEIESGAGFSHHLRFKVNIVN